MIPVTHTQAIAGSNYVTILLYHRFGDDRYPTTSVSLSDFEREMEYLKENGYRVLSINELFSIISSGKEIPPKSVLITVDDGYKTTLKAFQILKKYNFPFTVFLYMEAVDRYPDFLTSGDLKAMEASGLVTFGNHLYSHPDLAKKRLSMSRSQYLDFLQKEENLSRDRFKKLFRKEPLYFAFPYGSYDRVSLSFFGRRYRFVFSQDRGSFGGGEFPIPRMAIVGSLSSFRNFVSVLKVEPLPVVSHTPDVGVLKSNPTRIVFELENPENYHDCYIYVTDRGWFRARKTGKFVESLKPVEIGKEKSRIGLRCIDAKTGKRAEFFYLVLKGGTKPPN